MKDIYKIAVVLVLMVGQFQCIDPIEIQPTEAKRLLVIEGGISTLPGPHTVQVSKSAQYGSRAVDEIILETGAAVWIRDEFGEQVFLNEVNEGVYNTPAGWRAQVGSSYTLLINLQNGERYASLPELIVPVPPLKEITPVFFEAPALDEFSAQVGVELYGKWDDPADVDNFYMWDTYGVYKLDTYPENHIGRDFFGNPFPAPKDCCKTCYLTEERVNKSLRIFKDNFSNGNEQNELLSFIEDDGGRFFEKYMAVVEHSSLTKSAFQFFDILKNQLSISGDIFDPPTATIRGNMINLDNPDEEVIGFFRASDSKRDTIFIPRSLLANPADMRIINDDCLTLPNSTTEIPSFWQ